jgi:hypothetical protein
MATTRRAASLVLAITALAIGPWPVAAIDDTPAVALPAEAPSVTLPGTTYGAVTADLDGDGAPELVRLVAASDGSGRMSVDAWRQPASGEPVPLGERTLRRDASVDEQLSGLPRPGTDGTLPVEVNDAARLLLLHDHGRVRVVAAGIGLDIPGGRPCCLTLVEVGLDGSGVRLTPLAGQQQDAIGLVAIDLDHDGVDEVVAIELPDAGGRWPLRIYRPLTPGVRTRTVLVDATAIDVDNAIVADSDGVAGDELLAVANQGSIAGPSEPVLTRLAWRDGAPAVDIAPLSVPGPFAVLRHGGHPLIVLSSPELGQTVAASWPANGPLAVEVSAAEAVAPLTVIGSGTAERLLARPTADASGIVALDATLRSQPYLGPTPGAAAITAGGYPPLAPYAGPWPGGPDGTGKSPAFVVAGHLIQDGTTRSIGAMAGAEPVGSVGAGGRITALFVGDASHQPRPPALAAPMPGTIALVSTAQVLTPEGRDGVLPIGLHGAVPLPGDSRRLVTPGPSFDLLVSAPIGTTVVSLVDGQQPQFGLTGGAGREVTLSVDVGDRATAELRVLAVTPSGAGYATTWRVEQRAAPPPLAVRTPMVSLGGTVRLDGQTDPGVTVEVRGAPVAVGSDGRFSATVNAGLTPLDVAVQATDVVGNRARQTVSVVGWVDYRRLPWLGIVVLLTVAAGAALWQMAPGPRRWARRGPDDDAGLEELDA